MNKLIIFVFETSLSPLFSLDKFVNFMGSLETFYLSLDLKCFPILLKILDCMRVKKNKIYQTSLFIFLEEI